LGRGRQRACGGVSALGNDLVTKEKGPPGMAVQPKSREETPKVGTPWRIWPSHDANPDMGAFVLRCNLGPKLGALIGKNVAGRQLWLRPRGNARALTRRVPPSPSA